MVRDRKAKWAVDYYSLFAFGIIFFVLGIVMNLSVFWILGLIYMLAGLANKDKWKKNRRDWKKMNKKEKKLVIITIIILLILLLAGIVASLLTKGCVT